MSPSAPSDLMETSCGISDPRIDKQRESDEEDLGWCLVDSDPSIFQEMTSKLGVKDCQYEEIYVLEDSEFHRLYSDYGGILGLVFLFRFHEGVYSIPVVNLSTLDPSIFFAKQVVKNACATQALLSVLLNQDSSFDAGHILSDFKTFTADFPPEMKGFALGSQEQIKEIHNSLKPSCPVIFSEPESKKEVKDPFHFAAFVPHTHSRAVLLLDGLRDGPVSIGERNPNSQLHDPDWCIVALDMIKKIVEKLQTVPSLEAEQNKISGDVRFTLFAMVPDKAKQLKTKILQNLFHQHAAAVKLFGLDFDLTDDLTAALDLQPFVFNSVNENIRDEKWVTEIDLDSMSKLTGSDLELLMTSLPNETQELLNTVDNLKGELVRLKFEMQTEIDKRNIWTRESIIRHHDWTPSIFSLLKLMAQNKSLLSAYAEEKKLLELQRSQTVASDNKTTMNEKTEGDEIIKN